MGTCGGVATGASTPPPSRIVAVGDVHGDLEAARAALRLAGAIDRDNRWVGGNLTVVQTGDQLDRGDDEIEILEMFSRLEKESMEAGGAFIVLNGNHELMNVKQDFRYVTEEGWEDFEQLGLDTTALEEFPAGERGRRAAFRPGGPYARILAERDVVAVVGDTVFVHGGVLPHVAEYGVARLNRETRAWILGEREAHPEILLGEDGPVWSRHYSLEPDAEDCRLAGEALEILGARRMVVAHTVQEEGIASVCGERVWLIDVGMAEAYGGEPAVLVIEGGEVSVVSGS